MDPDKILLKPKSKEPQATLKKAVNPLIPIWTWGRNKTLQPYVKFRDMNCGEGRPVPAAEIGIKITF